MGLVLRFTAGTVREARTPRDSVIERTQGDAPADHRSRLGSRVSAAWHCARCTVPTKILLRRTGNQRTEDALVLEPPVGTPNFLHVLLLATRCLAVITGDALPEVSSAALNTVSQNQGGKGNVDLGLIQGGGRQPEPMTPTRHVDLHHSHVDVLARMLQNEAPPLVPRRRKDGGAVNIERGQYPLGLNPSDRKH